MNEAESFITRQARLKILQEIAGQIDNQLNEATIRFVLDAWNIKRDRDWVATQLRKMEQLGAVELIPTGTMLTARITPAGRDHLQERSVLVGIMRPSEDY